MLPPLLMCLSVDIKSYLFPSLACDQHVSPYSRNISWREGAMSGQDATLTEGKRKWSHLSPTRSWKEMGNSEGKRWSAFCYISVDGEASHYSSPPPPPFPFQTLPLWHWLRPALAAATTASCEQMGGTEQANMSCLMVCCKKYEDFFPLWRIQFRFRKCSKESCRVLYKTQRMQSI